MLDPWPISVAMLLGAYAVPVGSWPAHATHVVTMARDAHKLDDELVMDASTLCDSERAVFDLLAIRPMTPQQLAAALGIKPGALHARTFPDARARTYPEVRRDVAGPSRRPNGENRELVQHAAERSIC